jgi:hypothetical protein
MEKAKEKLSTTGLSKLFSTNIPLPVIIFCLRRQLKRISFKFTPRAVFWNPLAPHFLTKAGGCPDIAG